MVENGLGRSGRSTVYPPRDEDDEHPVAARDRALDDLAVVRRARDDGDPPLERVELGNALLPADAHHLVAAVERVLHQVAPELPGRADDADPHPTTMPTSPMRLTVMRSMVARPRAGVGAVAGPCVSAGYSTGISNRVMMPGSPPFASRSGSGSRVATQAYPSSG